MFSKLLSTFIFCFILYLIFTNFGTFLIIVAIFVLIIAFLISYLKKKFTQTRFNNFEFRFDDTRFKNENFGFDFRDFKNFNNSDFRNFQNNFEGNFSSEVQKAKDFFGFSHTPTKEDVKKRYKELAKKYHPDINNGSDEKMKELNNFRDVLMKIAQ